MDRNQVIHGDCLEEMKQIPDGSVDMILCDLPYGATACSWDTIIPFEPLWAQYKRVIKDNGAIVLNSSQPFTTDLINSNRKWFRYEWIWLKNTGTGFASAEHSPIKSHENILVFYKKSPVFNPQKTYNHERKISRVNSNKCDSISEIYNDRDINKITDYDSTERFPLSVQLFKKDPQGKGILSIQKPVDLCAYMIKTYTNPGELVLDSTAGSGTTGIACLETDRDYILIEKENKHIDIINERIRIERSQLKLPIEQQHDSVFGAVANKVIGDN